MTHSGPDEILAGSNFRSGGGCLDVCLHCLHLQPSKPSFLSFQLAPSGWPGTGWQVAAGGGGDSVSRQVTPSLELGLAAPPPTHTHNHTRNGERRSAGLPGRALESKDNVYFPWFSVSPT